MDPAKLVTAKDEPAPGDNEYHKEHLHDAPITGTDGDGVMPGVHAAHGAVRGRDITEF